MNDNIEFAAVHSGWHFLVCQGLSEGFYKWADKHTKEHGDLLMEVLADMYINARPKLKALYTAEQVARRMEQ